MYMCKHMLSILRVHTCTQNPYYDKRQNAYYIENRFTSGSYAIYKLILGDFMGAHVGDVLGAYPIPQWQVRNVKADHAPAP